MPITNKLINIYLQLVERRSEGSDTKFDFKNGFFDPENPYFDI